MIIFSVWDYDLTGGEAGPPRLRWHFSWPGRVSFKRSSWVLAVLGHFVYRTGRDSLEPFCGRWPSFLNLAEDHDFICRAELPVKHHDLLACLQGQRFCFNIGPRPGHGQVKELYKGQKVTLELHLENKVPSRTLLKLLHMQTPPSSRMP